MKCSIAAPSKAPSIYKVLQVQIITDGVKDCNVEVNDNHPPPPKWLPLEVSGLRFDFLGTRHFSAPGGHQVGPGDILPTGT